MKRTTLVIGLAALAVSGLGMWYATSNGNHSSKYRTALVERGNLLKTITATGTIEPEKVVDVGAQVTGLIKEFGPDPHDSSKEIDYLSEVEKDTFLAKIDPTLYESLVEQAVAQLGQMTANVKRAEADLVRLKSKLYQAERDWKRAQNLGPNNAISAADYDTARAAFEIAQADLAVGEAALVQAQKAEVQAQASKKQAETNLGYTIIRSPDKGVIIDRRVNVGQTVVSNLSASSLFLIAKDLRSLQIWASVNEADIGEIHKGQKVLFTVDAFPKDVFEGEVYQVRLNASMTQNVVTYTVVVNTDNSNGKLLPYLKSPNVRIGARTGSDNSPGKLIPYLTAILRFQVNEHKNVLKVPNAALRWRPQLQEMVPDAREAYRRLLPQKTPVPGDKATVPVEKESPDQGTVWVEDAGYVRPLAVEVGLTDGTMTEVAGNDLKEGLVVIVGSESQAQNGDGTTNPFTPKLPGKKRG